MSERRPAGRLRAIVATVGGAALAGVVVAGLAYGIVRQIRLDESSDRSVAQARLNLAFAEQNLPERPSPDEVTALFASFEGSGFEAVAETPAGSQQTSLGAGPGEVPGELRTLVDEGQLAYQRTTVGRVPQIVVGGEVPGSSAAMYFFFPEDALHRELRALAVAIAVGAALLFLVAAVAGRQAARHAFRARIEALAEARDRERRFSADVAHELRTPLTALVNEASLLREQLDRLPDQARRPAELLAADVDRLRRLVDDLLEVARLDSGEVEVRTEPVEVARLVAGLARSRGWEDAVSVRGTLALASDPRRLERILANLIGNGIEHGGGSVVVTLSPEGETARIEVADRGPGIPPAFLPEAFERFAKADAARSGAGTGLGLPIARENARLLGGDLEVDSRPGEGTRVALRLPVAEPLRAGDPAVALGADADRGDPGTGGDPR